MSQNSDELEDLQEHIKKYRNKRTYLKRALTILENYLDETHVDKEIINKASRQLEICSKSINALEEYLEEIYNGDFELEFEDIFKEKSVIDSHFSKLEIKLKSLNDAERQTQGSLTSQNPSKRVNKLPSISLQIFTGKFEEYISFRETFNSLIDSDESLSSIEKMQYLKSCLKNEAAETIKCLEISAQNYEHAKQILRERYENERIIATNHIRSLFELAALHKESYQGLRTILDSTSQHLRSLTAMGRPVEQWNDLLVYLITSKLPTQTRNEWENTLTTADLPSHKTLCDFLTRKCHALNAISSRDGPNDSNYKKYKCNNKPASCGLTVNKTGNCNYCTDNNHFTNQCPAFLNLSVEARIENVKNKRLCLNCLRRGHFTPNCKSSRCKKCSKAHNTLLHLDSLKHNENSPETMEGSRKDNVMQRQGRNLGSSSSTDGSHFSHDPTQSFHTIQKPSNIILSTCMIEIKDSTGAYHNARALLDSGSQINIITTDLAEKLNLRASRTNLPIVGINQGVTNSSLVTNAIIKSKFNNYSFNLDFYVLGKISSNLPIKSFDPNLIDLPMHLQLADPQFYASRKIDILIGAQIFYELLCVGQIRTNNKNICLQKSVFGWLLTGAVPDQSNERSSPAVCNLNTLRQLDKNIAKFWEIEHIPETPVKTAEQTECEEHFKNTIQRDHSGRFIASLPWISDPEAIGSSLEIAKKRFLNLEHKLAKDAQIKSEYDKFMFEYLQLGHMELIGDIQTCTNDGYFLPHHAVYKADSLTTKTRVVFDASCKSSTGVSLNDLLMLGPVLQNDLFSILARFRFYKYVLCSDITKMYRQILIHSRDTPYQKILYRFSPEEEIKVYQLKTLTYGTRPASFIATKCLFELASPYESSEPKLYKTITRDFYMDDLITGGNDEDELFQLRNKVINVLDSAGFPLRKWNSNNLNLLKDLDSNQENLVIRGKEDDNFKTLGIFWAPSSDKVIYTSEIGLSETRVTKRAILSHISKIFDPLGLLGPITTISKLIMQDMWKIKIGWDEAVPTELHVRWKEFASQLRDISRISIARQLVFENNSRIEIHAFADASERAYGACIFVREITVENKVNCAILCAKSRVAPLKTISIPRLELCASLLLTELVEKVINVSDIKFSTVNYYTDSTITLSWIKSCPNRWKTFIANRVTDIQNMSNVESWFHVSSRNNPADIISRGLYPSDLCHNDLWWHGPAFLHDVNFKPEVFDPKHQESVPEARVLEVTILSHEYNHELIEFSKSIFSKYSKFAKLIRVIATCKRFIFNCKNKLSKRFAEFTSDELNDAECTLIKIDQAINFANDIRELKNSQKLKNNSKIVSLSPFLDKNEILRVGGRLRHADLEFENKHPILIAKGLLCDLIITRAHEFSLHSGTQGTLAAVRLKYWPVSGRNTVKMVVRRCVLCFRHNPLRSQPKMADLPTYRVHLNRPFSRVGTDFFGPFHIKEGSRRSRKIAKSYGCVFICMATKAVHCELVENLTTEAFIASLKRFVGRRGLPAEIFCDNGTNYVGAANEMREINNFLNDDTNQGILKRDAASRSIKFHFNVPKGPHLGGLWEAAVKSFKRHVFKIASNSNLTFLELYTLLIEVEGILNSRPLIPLSQDPDDLNYLTPGHFLIGDNLSAIPEIDISKETLNKLSRWQYIQRLQQEFWSKWSKEYLQELQKRQKWRISRGSTIAPGLLVVIAEDNVPSRLWKLGRIINVHPGVDGEVRAASVRTASGVVKRPTVKLCVLPVETN